MINIDRLKPNFDEPVTRLETSILGGGAKAPSKNNDLVEQMICGYIEKVDMAELIKPIVIATFADLQALPAQGQVICFVPTNDGPELMNLVIAHARLIGIELVALRGYPGANDSAAYSQAVYSLPDIAYTELIADVATERRIAQLDKSQAGSRQKMKPREVALERNRSSHFDAFEEHKGLSDEISES